MQRRRLRLSHSSDEEEDQNQHQQRDDELLHQNPAVPHQPVTLSTPNPDPNPSQPDPVPISDEDFVDVSENLTPPSPPSSPPSVDLRPMEISDSPIGDVLLRVGLKLRGEWLESCLQGLQSAVPGFSSLDNLEKAKLCFKQFLFSDMNYSGGGVLPENVESMHLVDLAGPFVLQVDEMVNISCPLRSRYQDAASGVKRCLKLSMTDGVQRVFGMEYRPIKCLEVLASAGLKVAICNVHIRHGLLMLVPEALEVLGGVVEELDEARQCLVSEVNKPPRGKRTRTGVIPPLATRATLAAWPSSGDNFLQHTNTSTLQPAAPCLTHERGASFVPSSNYTSQRTPEEPTVPSGRLNAVPNPSPDIALDVQEMHINTVPISRGNAEYNSNSNTVPDVNDNPMVDEVEHPLILSGDHEVPFTYLASLSAKWAAMKENAASIQGKIKCFLTGVKGFQYKRRTKYELLCYVDDGSLISEILIDHNVVQRGIGHSPEEVTAALTSSDMKVVNGMKETMKQFQIFLVNFEGTMLVEMNKSSTLPIALEMNQGCSASDAWLLLRRLKSSVSSLTPKQPLDFVDISP
ncbi:hypothetical protein SLE2022_348650 [Rubroshorea leprosula]